MKITIDKAVLEQALDALERPRNAQSWYQRACDDAQAAKALREALAQPAAQPEMHDALCPALTGGHCNCSENPANIDKAWAQFCGGIGRGPKAPYPGMIEAFEAHYNQSFTDKAWRSETGVWAAAWKAAKLTAQLAAQQEPAAWWNGEWTTPVIAFSRDTPGIGLKNPNAVPLYTSPAVPLSDAKIDEIGATIFSADFLDVEEVFANRDFARAIEAAHKIGGTE